MPDFSAYDSYNTQSVSGVSGGTAQPVGGPALYSLKSLKRKRSESTDDSDDGEDRDYNYHHTRLPSFGLPYTAPESSYALSKSDDRGHAAKRARLADDFAELRLRGQSLSPTSGTCPSSTPLWVPAPTPIVEEPEQSPPLPRAQAQASVEIDPTDEYEYEDVQLRRVPYPPASNVDIDSMNILRGEVEEVVTPGVQAERSRNKTTTNGGGHDTKMHGTSSYEPEKDRASLRFRPPPSSQYVLTSPSLTHRDSHNRPRRLLRLRWRVFFHQHAIHIDAIQNFERIPVAICAYPPSGV